MKISTRGRYALRLMLDLALADPEEYCSVKSIAARQQISEKYMEQIISQLVKAGLCAQRARRTRRLPIGLCPREIHSGADPAADGGRPCYGSVPCTGRAGMPAGGAVRHALAVGTRWMTR